MLRYPAKTSVLEFLNRWNLFFDRAFSAVVAAVSSKLWRGGERGQEETARIKITFRSKRREGGSGSVHGPSGQLVVSTNHAKKAVEAYAISWCRVRQRGAAKARREMLPLNKKEEGVRMAWTKLERGRGWSVWDAKVKRLEPLLVEHALHTPSQCGDYFPEAHPLVHVRIPASLEELYKRSWPCLVHRRSNTFLHLPRKSIRCKIT